MLYRLKPVAIGSFLFLSLRSSYALPSLEPPAFFSQFPDCQARPEGWPFPLLPFLHLPYDFFHVECCVSRGRHQLGHWPSMFGYQEPFASAHSLQ